MDLLTRIGRGIAFALLAWMSAASSVDAAELVMVETAGCPWCRAWHREIGPAYPKTSEGQKAPLRRVDLSELPTLSLRLQSPVFASPTFLLVDDGNEIGRITGYPGQDFFWGLLDQQLQRMPDAARQTLN